MVLQIFFFNTSHANIKLYIKKIYDLNYNMDNIPDDITRMIIKHLFSTSIQDGLKFVRMNKHLFNLFYEMLYNKHDPLMIKINCKNELNELFGNSVIELITLN